MPPVSRHSTSRHESRHEQPGAISPVESIASVAVSHAGVKRKERDFERNDEETNINVVVRCRGRNEREVRENSGVVLSTNGVKSKFLELSMGPSALSNKTYQFDKVFSSAADQAIIYDDVVTPILEEMLSGYNCTIFAYGQTGTGKTYTMTGDMDETYGILSDSAGIIPRALHALFTKLEINDAEWSVKCSFIELYNEELRDLISPDDNARLKIYDDNSNKKGYSSTIVQGMEETHIKSAVEGIKLLQAGSLKRQVAATKCNDLSSRSHTVFTVTAYIKRTGENGEDYISAGKLNLVDLAGSENIQRSGAENKRAAEAGLINKSLLTLGRVINALVDRSSHIPYRESKLTRLLQDSLGGRTKTCIIATVSPAKSNLEETISTLDYAFRAKNIRNKPQINQMINKRTLLKDFTVEIEKLKSELIATRQRNGVYLSNENFEEMTRESESRRILSEEQAAKIQTMEMNLRNKVQELFSLTANFMNLKKENEMAKAALDETKSVLEQTELVLETTRKSLTDEMILRKAHQETEEQLCHVANELISTLDRTVDDINGLHAKNSRKSDLHTLNRGIWNLAQARVSDVTGSIESTFEDFKAKQQGLTAKVSAQLKSFVSEELEKVITARASLQENINRARDVEKKALEKTDLAKKNVDSVLEEIKSIRENVKVSVGESLQELLAVAAERISEELISELGCFHAQLQKSYSSLESDVKLIFEDVQKILAEQNNEVVRIHHQFAVANDIERQSNAIAFQKLDNVLHEERNQAAVERQELLAKITELIVTQGKDQETRLDAKISDIQRDVMKSRESFDTSRLLYVEGIDSWHHQGAELVEKVLQARESLETKLKEDWLAANERNSSLLDAANSVHTETTKIVDSQVQFMENQMQSLDDFVTRAASQNAENHHIHDESMKSLSSTVQTSYSNFSSHLIASSDHLQNFGHAIRMHADTLDQSLEQLASSLCPPLTHLRETVSDMPMHEYAPTGATPQKTIYSYPAEFPRTLDHDVLLASPNNPLSPRRPKTHGGGATVPFIFSDVTSPPRSPPSPRSVATAPDSPPSALGLRELDVNLCTVAAAGSDAVDDPALAKPLSQRPSVRSRKGNGPQGKLPVWNGKQLSSSVASLLPLPPSSETGRRRSPRIASS
ncbi:Kinesin-like protein [Podosphaera aphanis]|nr:Kinesin-like protein [Podosphaera aphanis]